APSVAVGELEVARPLLIGTVEIVVARDARTRAGGDERIAELPLPQAHVRHAQRAAGAVQLVGAALLVLRALEVRQHVLPAPPGLAGRAPAAETLAVASDVGERVDGARSAENTPARPRHRATVEMGLGTRPELPGDGGVGEVAVVARRDMDPWVAVAPAR